ncbi:MAG TPA: alpha-amylase family glycosyl hydrolase [Bacillales bacterium]
MQIKEINQNEMMKKLRLVYGEEHSTDLLERVKGLVDQYKGILGERSYSADSLTEKDTMLITYGDSIYEEGLPSLKVLHQFLNTYVGNTFSALHILPFFPYSSDDGFSVIDYFEVAENLGDWSDISNLADQYELMFDAVINHISAQSKWFQKYLQGKDPYKEFFIEMSPDTDTSSVRRPRSLPLLTPFNTVSGTKYLWTTFSEDQIDLNFKSEEVLLKVIELLLFYVEKGARYIRLDAVGFIWKEVGTSCIHLDQAHQLIQLLRSILEQVAPGTKLITETNVPHHENISYFGDGTNEAHMVYQFTLPPLTLHAFQTGRAQHLLKWADGLDFLPGDATFFNFLASHDGIGLTPTEGILDTVEVDRMIQLVEARGGYVSYKENGDGTHSPYELNISYFNALSDSEEPDAVRIRKFLAAHAVLLSLKGVPGIYIHSLLGSQNDEQGVENSGRYRSINREKLEIHRLTRELQKEKGIRSEVLHGLTDFIHIRKQQPAFHPKARQEVLFLNEHVFSLVRTSRDAGSKIVVLINVSNEVQTVEVDLEKLGGALQPVVDLISGDAFDAGEERLNLSLSSYQVMWLQTGK